MNLKRNGFLCSLSSTKMGTQFERTEKNSVKENYTMGTHEPIFGEKNNINMYNGSYSQQFKKRQMTLFKQRSKRMKSKCLV